MIIDAADWYDHDPELKNPYQGDVLDGVPLVFPQGKNLRWVLLRPLPEGKMENARSGLPRKYHANIEGELPTAWARPEGELVMAAAAVYRIMILSRSCNLDWKKQVQVAPVYQTEGLPFESLAGLRENDDDQSFFLPFDTPDMPESYVDLGHITTVSVSYIRRMDKLVRRLSSRATIELQNSLSEFYARPYGFNVKDGVPQTAKYRCAGCFMSGQPTVPVVQISTGQDRKFPECAKCGNDALWVKIQEPKQENLFAELR
jgi:hypothetical protein